MNFLWLVDRLIYTFALEFIDDLVRLLPRECFFLVTADIFFYVVVSGFLAIVVSGFFKFSACF